MSVIDNAIRMIEDQQTEFKPHTPAYVVGEQLKDIARTIPGAAELLVNDLAVKSMSIDEAEKKIRQKADELHKEVGGNCVAVSPEEAREILFQFYGIHADPGKSVKPQGDTVDLSDFF